MSQLLLSELTSLSSEARRKHPEIKHAVDTFLTRLKSDTEGTLSACQKDANPALEHPLLKPVLLSCQTKLPKVISLALSLLQRILLQRLVPAHTVPTVIVTLNTLVKAGRIDVDVQLKILQIASALLSSYPSIHNDDLAETLMLGFRLQETSKVAVVSSTAAATLRQSVMTVFDKVKDEDAILNGIKAGGEEAAAAAPLAALSVDIPGSASVTLFPSSRDAYLLFSDLCSLASGEETQFLSLNSLSKTFSLELIESILTNHPRLFTVVKSNSSTSDTAHPELLFLLRSRTCPLLIRSLSEPPAFPIYLRLMRLLFLLLRQFSADLILEVEILMTILLRNVHPSPQDIKSHGTSPPLMWQQVLALEVIRSLCSNDVFLRSLWEWFDAQQNKGSESVQIFSKLVDTLQSALIQGEKVFAADPSMVLIPDKSSQVAESPRRSKIRESLDRSFSSSGLYEAAAGVASAAMSGVFQTTNGGGSEILSSASSPAVQIIDQLDKIEPPAPGSATLPKTYPQLLALQSFHFVTQSLAGFALPIYSKLVNSRPADAAPAPPAITEADISSLKGLADRNGLITTKEMLSSSAERISDVLTRCLRIKSSDTIFEETLLALRNLTNVTGALGLLKQRNAIILSFVPFGVPGFDSSDSTPSLKVDLANLSNRNLACLRAFAQVVYYLSGSLGTFWYPVLEALCAAQSFLSSVDSGVARRSLQTVSEADTVETEQQNQNRNSATLSTLTHTSSLDTRSGKSQLQLLKPSDLQPSQIETQIRNIFQNSSSLSDEAFFDFVSSLCKLSNDLVDASSLLTALQGSSDEASPRTSGFSNVNRRSRSVIKTEGLPFFPFSCISLVASLNIGRLCRLPSSKGWDLVLTHLSASLSSSRLHSSWRLQAGETVNTILLLAMGEQLDLPDSEERLRLQKQVFAVFAQAGVLNDRQNTPTDLAIRTSTVASLQKVLETYGHSLLWGWNVFFAVCHATCSANAASQPPATSKSYTSLVKAGFSCLQLICSDYLSLLDRAGIRSCVECLKAFGQQAEDVNVALTSIGCLWGVTAEMASRANVESSRVDIDDLWLYLLRSLLDLSQDPRSEVRNGAISNLFQVLQQYGETLDSAEWAQIANTILFPLVRNLDITASRVTATNASSEDTAAIEAKDREAGLMGYQPSELKQWQESQSLALSQLGEIIRDFLVTKLVKSEGFESIWSSLLSESKAAFLKGPPTIAQAAIKCLSMALSVDLKAESSNEKIILAWDDAWETWVQIGQNIPDVLTFQFSQKNLLAYIQTFPHIYKVTQSNFKAAEDSARLLACLRSCISYTQCSDHTKDVDNLTSVQEAARATARSISDIKGVTPLLVADLSDSISLAYPVTSTEVKDASKPTFVALSRLATSEAVQMFLDHETDLALYTEGALESLLSALKIPIKLKYDCPPSSSSFSKSKHRPLWQQATLAFCNISHRCCRTLHAKAEQLGQQKVKQIWTKLIDVLEAALLADSTTPSEVLAEEKDTDERFGLFVLGMIENSILPYLGASSVTDELIERLGTIIARASTLYSADEDAFGERDGGRLDDIVPVANERAAYWCFDLLFLGCSKPFVEKMEADVDSKGPARIATMFSRHLVKRCEGVLSTYVEDVRIRGMMPMHRIREEEINYVLSQYLDLRVWPGSLGRANTSTDWQKSHLAHLFSAYRLLISLLQLQRQSGASPTTAMVGTSLPSMLPSDWESEVAKHNLVPGIVGQRRNVLRAPSLNNQAAVLEKVEARDLAARALQLIGDALLSPTL